MMRDHVAPALRALGFKGTGQVFSLPIDTHYAMLGFQKSRSSSAAEVLFTVNVLVVSKESWKLAREDWSIPQRPSPNASWGELAWSRRIGSLLPERQDRWWRLSSSSSAEGVSSEVLMAIRQHVLPAMRERLYVNP
jgi:hypothetical protein